MRTVCPRIPSDWVDLQQAAREYPYSRRTFWKFISAGQLTAYRPTGKKILLRRSEIDAFFAASPVEQDVEQIVDAVVKEVLGRGGAPK